MRQILQLPTKNLQDKIVYRLVKSSDLPQLEWNGEFSHFRNVFKNAFEKSLTGKSKLWVVEILQVGLVGQAFVQLISSRLDLANGVDRAYIYAFRFKENYRNIGLGSSLLKIIESDLVNNNYKEATLNVARENIRAIHFYQKHGFKIVAEESGEWSYRDHNNELRTVVEPAWKMVKYLT
jgi:ribosomal protein S18 acetylase RimI-like enzyme